MSKYTIAKAVDDLCNKWRVGEKMSGMQICNTVRFMLNFNGNPACPMDGTITRAFREAKEHTYTGIVCTSAHKSEFTRIY